MRRLVVVGAGISGLAAAWAAQQHAASVPDGLEVLVLERAGEVGGKAQSMVRGGWLLEGGPSGFLGGRPEMERLIDGAGMRDALVPADAGAARRYLFRAGRLRRVVSNPIGFLLSGILSARGVARLLGEPFVPARLDGLDESVWEFAARRLGPEVADRLVLPMTLGFFAGDAKRLSVAAAFPKMVALEREHGSVIRGMVARRGRTSSGTLRSFRGGMQQLPRALAARGGFTVRCGAAVQAIVRAPAGWNVTVAHDAEAVPADAVILAGEPWASAALLRAELPVVADALTGIACPAVTVVGLGYGPAGRRLVPRGFGVLIARDEGYRMLGNLWETETYPGRGPRDHLLIRALYGGAVDPEAGAMDESTIGALARDEVARLYGVSEAPTFVEVVRVPRAIPQYEIGHRDRVLQIEQALTALPGVHLTGFGLRGTAFADAASDGVRIGTRAVEELVARRGTHRAT